MVGPAERSWQVLVGLRPRPGLGGPGLSQPGAMPLAMLGHAAIPARLQDGHRQHGLPADYGGGPSFEGPITMPHFAMSGHVCLPW